MRSQPRSRRKGATSRCRRAARNASMRAVGDMRKLGVKAAGIVVDLATEQGCKEFVEGAAKELGSIDILVNNVGGMIPGTLESLGAEQWDRRAERQSDVGRLHDQVCAAVHQEGSCRAHPQRVGRHAASSSCPARSPRRSRTRALIGFTKLMAGDLGAARHHGQQHLPRASRKIESWGPRAEAMAKVRGINSGSGPRWHRRADAARAVGRARGDR